MEILLNQNQRWALFSLRIRCCSRCINVFERFGPLSCNHFDFHLFKFVSIQSPFFLSLSLSSVVFHCFLLFFVLVEKLGAQASPGCGETIVDETMEKGPSIVPFCSALWVCGWQIVLSDWAKKKKSRKKIHFAFTMQIPSDAWPLHRQINFQLPSSRVCVLCIRKKWAKRHTLYAHEHRQHKEREGERTRESSVFLIK